MGQAREHGREFCLPKDFRPVLEDLLTTFKEERRDHPDRHGQRRGSG